MAVGLGLLVLGLWWAASATSNEEPLVDPPSLDIRQRVIDDLGQWSPAIFSSTSLDGQGFVGLSNDGGRVRLIESVDGFTIEQEHPTDFPFGYFTNAMETTESGYHVIGHLARIEDAVFTSPNGLDWERFEIDIPLPATALDIDHFHRSADTAALIGSIGSAGSFTTRETVAMWWDADGTQFVIAESPCFSETDGCAMSSVISVADGFLVTHEREGSVALSRWSREDGWASVAFLSPDAFESATLFATANAAVWFLDAHRIVRSDDGGRNWNLSAEAPPGERGRFIGMSATGSTSVFQTETDLWLGTGGTWSPFPLEDASVDRLLALTDETALLGGSTPNGAASIRLVPRDA